jgi:hypothetical protein
LKDKDAKIDFFGKEKTYSVFCFPIPMKKHTSDNPEKKKRNKPLTINIQPSEFLKIMVQVPKEEIDAVKLQKDTEKK